jgi:ketosteroid isomerase-like protein
MSQENVEVVRKVFEAATKGVFGEGRSFSPEAILGFLSSDVEWHSRGDLPDSEVYRGHAGVRRLFARFDEVMEDIWFEVAGELIGAGDRVVAPLRWGGRGKGSGVDFVEEQEAWVLFFGGGKIVRVEEYATRAEALEAAGLSE